MNNMKLHGYGTYKGKLLSKMSKRELIEALETMNKLYVQSLEPKS